jgi:hypothetical protein
MKLTFVRVSILITSRRRINPVSRAGEGSGKLGRGGLDTVSVSTVAFS